MLCVFEPARCKCVPLYHCSHCRLYVMFCLCFFVCIWAGAHAVAVVEWWEMSRSIIAAIADFMFVCFVCVWACALQASVSHVSHSIIAAIASFIIIMFCLCCVCLGPARMHQCPTPTLSLWRLPNLYLFICVVCLWTCMCSCSVHYPAILPLLSYVNLANRSGPGPNHRTGRLGWV